jgi:hypothetical protein
MAIKLNDELAILYRPTRANKRTTALAEQLPVNIEPERQLYLHTCRGFFPEC